MAQIIFTFQTAEVISEILTAAAAQARYRAKLKNPITGEETDNPETVEEFGKRMVQRMLLDLRKQYRVEQAMAAARAAELAKITE